MESRDPLRALQLEVSRLRKENVDLKDELTNLRSSVRALSALQELIHRMDPSTDVIQMLDTLLASVLAGLGTEDGSLILHDEETGELVFAVVHGQARERLTGFRMPPGRGIAGWVVKNLQPEVVQDVRNDPRFYPRVDETFGFHTQTLACVPLLDGKRVLGVIEAVNKISDREFTPEDHDLLMVVAQLASLVIKQAESLEDTSG